jgi:hypothetical protein
LPDEETGTFTSLLAKGDSDFMEAGFEAVAPLSRSIGVGGVTVVKGVVKELGGGVLGVVMSDGRFLFPETASLLTVCIVAGRGGASVATFDALRFDKLPRLSLLKNPDSVFPPPKDDIEARSGLPF